MKKQLMVAFGLVIGLPVLNANAEFTGYYAIDNPAPGGYQVILAGATGPIISGNWQLWSESRSIVEFQRSPADASRQAQGFTLTVKNSLVPGALPNVGSFEILQMPTNYPNPNLLDSYTFTYNFGLPVLGNEAKFEDALGTHTLTGTGSAVFYAPRGNAGATWGFYVTQGNTGLAPLSGVLQIQDWKQVPEPSSVAMALVSGFGGLGFAIRRYRLGKSRNI